ncbi:MAG: DUF2007 domain-containing protein [Sedimentisphaerales bacterium]|nr:DUF2007 domain-containing protein [Sedimentisphaerales bacterium]
MMDEKLVTVARFEDGIEAELAKQLLADNGIKSVVTGENVANTFSGMVAGADVEVQTFESDARRAIEILESNEKQEE